MTDTSEAARDRLIDERLRAAGSSGSVTIAAELSPDGLELAESHEPTEAAEPNDPAAAEAAQLLAAMPPPPEPAPEVGPSVVDVAEAACLAMGHEPTELAAISDDAATHVRRTLGMAADAPVTYSDCYAAKALERRAEHRWQQLNERALAEGWRRNPRARREVGEEYDTWHAGRRLYEPGYRPGPKPGPRSPVGPPPINPDGLMDVALREAARMVRQTGRDVTIHDDRVIRH